MTNAATLSRLQTAKRIARERYAWPGGYELFAVMDDGGIVCGACTRAEFRCIASSTLTSQNDGWTLVGVDHTGNADTDIIACDHCARVIYQPEE